MRQDHRLSLEAKIQYAIRLSDPEFKNEPEDLFKLACLCEEVAELEASGEVATESLLSEFNLTIKAFFEKSGGFRQEVEHNNRAKRRIVAI